MKTINFIHALLRRKPDKIYKTFKVFYWDIPSMAMSWCGSIYVPTIHSDDTIRHECGHCRQYQFLGFWKYILIVAIPSLIGTYKYKHGGKTYDKYVIYKQIKSEAEADKLGGNQFWENSVLKNALIETEIEQILNDKIKE